MSAATPNTVHVKVVPDIHLPVFEYAEVLSLGEVNEKARAGWRVHLLHVSPQGDPLYLLERVVLEGDGG